MSKNFHKVQEYYTKQLWSIEKVRNAVLKGWITEEEFKEITNEDF